MTIVSILLVGLIMWRWRWIYENIFDSDARFAAFVIFIIAVAVILNNKSTFSDLDGGSSSSGFGSGNGTRIGD